MRFVSYNIHRAIDTGGTRSIRSIASVLTDLDADVVGLNEVVRLPVVWDQPFRLGHWLGMEVTFQRATLRRGAPFGNAVLVRGRILDARRVRLPGGHEPRGMLVADITVDDRHLSFATTHLDLHPAVRDQQLAAVATELPRDRPVVLAGDFNATRERLGPVLERLTAAPPHPTFPVPDPVAAIDHVLFSSHWRLVDSFAVPRAASDHAALVVDLELSAL